MKKNNIFSLVSETLSTGTAGMQSGITAGFQRYPKRFFLGMVSLLACSGILCFTLLRKPSPKGPAAAVAIKAQTGSQIGEIYSAAGKLSRVLQMQSELSGLLSHQDLSSGDSIRIMEMIGEIKKLQHNNNQGHEKNQP